jgi:hypothetical protein
LGSNAIRADNCHYPPFPPLKKVEPNPLLHLRTFKTPPSGAVMSDEDDADCAFSMRKGVKKWSKNRSN